MLKRAISATALLVLSLAPLQARAYTYFQCANTGLTTTTQAGAAKWSAGFYLNVNSNSNNFPTGTFRTALEFALGEWNKGPQLMIAAFQYSTAVAGALQNNISEVTFNNSACSDGCAYVYAVCGSGISEVDIRFKSVPSAPWTTSASKTQQFVYG